MVIHFFKTEKNPNSIFEPNLNPSTPDTVAERINSYGTIVLCYIVKI